METHYTKSLGGHAMDAAHQGSLLPPSEPPARKVSANMRLEGQIAQDNKQGTVTLRAGTEGDGVHEQSAGTFRIQTLAFAAALVVSAALGLFMGTLF